MVAPLTLTVYRYAAFLTLITFHSLILCQYKCGPASCQLSAVVLHCEWHPRPRPTCCILQQSGVKTSFLASQARSAADLCQAVTNLVNLPLHCQARCWPEAGLRRTSLTVEKATSLMLKDTLCSLC